MSCLTGSLIHRGSASQHTRHEGSSANVLSPDSTGQLQGSCTVHTSVGRGYFDQHYIKQVVKMFGLIIVCSWIISCKKKTPFKLMLCIQSRCKTQTDSLRGNIPHSLGWRHITTNQIYQIYSRIFSPGTTIVSCVVSYMLPCWAHLKKHLIALTLYCHCPEACVISSVWDTMRPSS